MQWASHASSGANMSEVIARAGEALQETLGGGPADLALVFVAPHFHDYFDQLADLVQEHLPSRCIVGCAAGGVIGSGRELEDQPALSLIAARLPGIRVHTFSAPMHELPDMDAAPAVWRAWLGLPPGDWRGMLLLADALASPAVESLLAGLDYALPTAPKAGGLSAGGPDTRSLFLDHSRPRGCAVGVAFAGPLRMDTIVSQGCRPIGAPLVVTRCRENVLEEVDGQAPLKYLGDLMEQLDDYDRDLMRNALLIGLQLDTPSARGPASDRLIRNLVGIDYQTGILAINAPLQPGQVVQFHLRDKLASAEDLQRQLQRYSRAGRHPPPSGALLFSCLGRGRSLYHQPDHDSRCFQASFGSTPLGGCFCNGEIGPVAGTTHLHGYTSAFALFSMREDGNHNAL